MSDDEKLKEATEHMKARPQVSEKQILEMRDKVTNKVEKWANRIQVSMAFTPKVIHREGERWTDENGKNWEMKGGIAQNSSTTQSARMPIWCPVCTKPMNHRFDRKFYNIRGWCFNCNIEKDGEMIARMDGSWEKYQRQLERANEVAALKEKIVEHTEYIRTFRAPQIHFEDGRWEEIASKTDFTLLFEKLEADIDFCLARLEFLQKQQEQEEQNVE